MSLHDLVLKNRSYRSFNSARSVTEEELLALVECARICPSAANKQPLRYRLVSTPAEMARVLAHTKWAAALPDWHFPPDGHEPTAAIVICHDRDVIPSESASATDVGIAAQTMLLAAAERGLGGCMIANFHRADLHGDLTLAENIVPVLVIALGEPDEEILLETVGKDGVTSYYRDADGVHHVPKRALSSLLV